MPRLTTEDILNLIYDAVAGGIGVEVHGTEDSSTLSVVSPSADGIANNANYWVRVMAGLYPLAPHLTFYPIPPPPRRLPPAPTAQRRLARPRPLRPSRREHQQANLGLGRPAQRLRDPGRG